MTANDTRFVVNRDCNFSLTVISLCATRKLVNVETIAVVKSRLSSFDGGGHFCPLLGLDGNCGSLV